MKTTKGTSLANNARRYTRKTVAGLLSVVFFAACCPITFAAEDPSVPLTPDELAGMTHKEIAAISREQSDATLNKMAQLFQDGEKQGLDEYLAALGFATTYEEYEAQKEEEWLEEQASLEPSIQPLWQSDYGGSTNERMCHETLTSYGFLMYIGAMQELFGMSGSFGYTLSDMQTLAEWSGYPDYQGSGQVGIPVFAGHFYDPDTGNNYNFSSTNTAKTNAQFYYKEGVSFYQNNRTEALKNLSYCLHYVQDVGVPHHAANKLAVLSNHSDFEELASQLLIDEGILADVTPQVEKEYYSSMISKDIGDFVHEIATVSKSYISAAMDESNIEGQKLVLLLMLPYSAVNTSAVLYKFAKEVGII
ncbi:MAG: hypothetical protein ACLU8W_08665 [Clostridia bacterium]